MVDREDFKEAMSRFASGVTVVTCRDGEQTRGITVSAFLSVSLEPPLVLVSISKDAQLAPLLASSESYGVSLLGVAQRTVSDHFAGWGPEGFEPCLEELAGEQVLVDALAGLSCRIRERIDAGDHQLLLGEVSAISLGSDLEPLLYAQRGYRHLAVVAEED